MAIRRSNGFESEEKVSVAYQSVSVSVRKRRCLSQTGVFKMKPWPVGVQLSCHIPNVSDLVLNESIVGIWKSSRNMPTDTQRETPSPPILIKKKAIVKRKKPPHKPLN